jgi:Cysteine-rich CPXCG
MSLLEEKRIQCPYCWEHFSVLIDLSTPYQEYVEDCFVCCRPIVFIVESENGELSSLTLRAENE